MENMVGKGPSQRCIEVLHASCSYFFCKKKTANSDILHGNFQRNFHSLWKSFTKLPCNMQNFYKSFMQSIGTTHEKLLCRYSYTLLPLSKINRTSYF